jgi:peroxiredoxin
MVDSLQAPRRIQQGLILALVIFAVVVAGTVAVWGRIVEVDKQKDVGPEKGQIAPDFSAYTPDGEKLLLSDFSGKIVMLNFFATWCGPCNVEAPHLKAAFERTSGNIVFLGVTTQDTPGTVQAFATEYDLPFPLLLDNSGEVGWEYRVHGLPTTFFIRADGVIHFVVKGPMTKEFLELILEGMADH